MAGVKNLLLPSLILPGSDSIILSIICLFCSKKDGFFSILGFSSTVFSSFAGNLGSGFWIVPASFFILCSQSVKDPGSVFSSFSSSGVFMTSVSTYDWITPRLISDSMSLLSFSWLNSCTGASVSFSISLIMSSSFLEFSTSAGISFSAAGRFY
jgi:hypothetical protein